MGSGQDGETRCGESWPEPRFVVEGDVVRDRLTELIWSRTANAAGNTLMWQEALDFIAAMNRECAFGYGDWRLPNRHELRSLVSHQTHRPALPEGHPFLDLFPGWYWSSTTAAVSPAHAWYVHMEGARMVYGGKDQSFLVWRRSADLTGRAVKWSNALRAVQQLNEKQPYAGWRLPNINELESLVDCRMYAPALPVDAVFTNLHDSYWSSTTSVYEPDWAWALYLDKGAVGVGQKSGAYFHVWAVRSEAAGSFLAN